MGNQGNLARLVLFVVLMSSTWAGKIDSKHILLELRSGPVYTSETNDRHGIRDTTQMMEARGRRLLMEELSNPDEIGTLRQEWGSLRDAVQVLVGQHLGMDHDAKMALHHHLDQHHCQVMGYMPNETLLVVGKREHLKEALVHDLIAWATPYKQTHKIAPEWDHLLEQVESLPERPGNQSLDYSGLPIEVMKRIVHDESSPRRITTHLFGIRVLFPVSHEPKPYSSSHPHHKLQLWRIQEWKSARKGMHAGMAAIKDWSNTIRQEFGPHAEIHHAGPHAAIVYVEPRFLRKAVEWVANRDAVHWVEPMPRLEAKNRLASTITQSSRVPPLSGTINTNPEYHPLWAAGITGKDMVIGIGDSGLDYRHCFFADPDEDWSAQVEIINGVSTFISTTHRKIRLYRAFADFRDDNGHGTHTAGTLAGMPYGNTLAEASGVNIGMAPDAKLAFIDLSSVRDGDAIRTPRDLVNEYFRYTTDVGASVHSDSWGSSSIFYDYEARQIDAFCWENPTFLPVFPAGNDGDRVTASGSSGSSTVNSPATAKNCLSVGATQTAGEIAVTRSISETSTATIKLNDIDSMSFPVLLSTFSPGFGTLNGGEFGLVPTTPSLACSPITNAEEIAGKVALIERGTCNFVDKALEAERAGAVAVIVYDNVAGAYFAPDTNGERSNIPTGIIPRRIGQNIIASINSGQTATISFGPPAPGDVGYENLAAFSSQGPVGLDRRIKPDIVAPGTVASAKSGTECQTSIYGGTSMATPVVAGSAALVQQYFRDGFYPTGVSLPENGFMPTSALVKAVMMGGAVPITGYEADTGLPIDPPPSFRQGYGRVFLGGSLKIEGNPYNPTGFQVLDSIEITGGESHKFCINALGGPLSVTLAWTDYPGNPSSPRSLVNDLDLVVRAQGLNGVTLLGNGGDIDDSSKPDNVNNVESVVIPTLPAGRVSIDIRGSSVQPGIGPQPYALVILGEFSGTLVAPSGESEECQVVAASIISGPGSLTNAEVVTFEFGLNGQTASGVEFECKLEFISNGAAVPAEWQPCVSPQSYPGLQDGEYSFSVRPKGENSVANQVFVHDSTPPNVSVTKQASVPGSSTFEVSATDITKVTTICKLEVVSGSPNQSSVLAGEVVAGPITLGEWFNCSSLVSMAWLLPGDWVFSVQATDQAGNSANAEPQTFSIPTSPTGSRAFIQKGPFLTIAKSDVTFTMAAMQGKQQLPSANFECALLAWPSDLTDPGMPANWEQCAAEVSYGAIQGGKYTFFSRLVGSEIGESAMSVFTVDEIAPTVSIPNQSTVVSTSDITIQFEPSEDGSTMECKLTAINSPSDNMDWMPCISPVQFRNLTGGQYIFEVVATDAVGNKGESSSSEFIVDLEPPIVTVDYNQGTRDSSITINFVADDGPTGSGIENVTCQLVPLALVGQGFDASDPKYDPQICESPWTFTGLQEGMWKLSILATDKSGKVSSQEDLRVWMDTRPPTVNITAGPSRTEVNPGGTAIFNLSEPMQEDLQAFSPVLWQGYLVKLDSEPETDDQTSDPAPNSDGSAVKTLMSDDGSSGSKSFKIDSQDVVLGPENLNQWANCSFSSCIYSDLPKGEYSFTARGVDLAGNVGEESDPYTFEMEGSSSGLPTWALIVIIVGSSVVGILLIAVLWCCCCHKTKKPSPGPTLNGAYLPQSYGGYPHSYQNGYSNQNGFTPSYQNGYGLSNAAHGANGGAIAGARPFVGAISDPVQPPTSDPVAAQRLALSMASTGALNEDEQLKQAIQASLRETRPRYRPAVDDSDLDAAIAASLSEQQPQYSWSRGHAISRLNFRVFLNDGMFKGRRLAVGSAVLAGAGGVAVCAIMKKSFTPRIKSKPTKWNEAILKLCPHLSAEYHLPAILNNGHVETIFAALFRRNPHITYEREILHMPDGGAVALDAERSDRTAGVSGLQTLDDTAPVLILLPGLTGGSGDTYVQHAVIHARKAGIRAIVFNSRGTSKSPVVTPQFYSASFTQDMRCVVAHLASKYPKSRLFAAGWSLGANILTRYLGEEGENTPIQAAVVMCNPFDLPYCDKNFKRGFNRIYDWNLAKALRKIYQEHHSLFVNATNRGIKSYDPERALRARTIRDFDDAITRISFGWDSVDNYYAGSSSSLSIPNVKIPCLVIQAEDDPIAPKQAIPFKALDDNPNCILVTTPTGGHLGWCSGENGILGAPWTDMALNQYFSAVNNLLDDDHIPRMSMSERPGVWLVSTQQETV